MQKDLLESLCSWANPREGSQMTFTLVLLQIQAVTLPTMWDPQLFPDPDVVRPERHLDDLGQFVKNEQMYSPTPNGMRLSFLTN